MKKQDIGFIIFTLLIVSPFLPIGIFESFQKNFLFNENLWHITSFLKFAILATLGESIGLRIKNGVYNQKGFGLIPRAIVWGVLGVGIKMAFVIFAVGTPVLLVNFFGLNEAVASMDKEAVPDVFTAFEQGIGWTRVITAVSISVLMNLIFAPVFMTLHKITDTHIIDNGGTIGGFFKPIKFGEIFPRVNWFIQWDFVFKKTIPFFWIPAHTVTFLMPGEYRIAFAAVLGIVLGILLAIASLKGSNK
jgi:hypothetical protein